MRKFVFEIFFLQKYSISISTMSQLSRKKWVKERLCIDFLSFLANFWGYLRIYWSIWAQISHRDWKKFLSFCKIFYFFRTTSFRAESKMYSFYDIRSTERETTYSTSSSISQHNVFHYAWNSPPKDKKVSQKWKTVMSSIVLMF